MEAALRCQDPPKTGHQCASCDSVAASRCASALLASGSLASSSLNAGWRPMPASVEKAAVLCGSCSRKSLEGTEIGVYVLIQGRYATVSNAFPTPCIPQACSLVLTVNVPNSCGTARTSSPDDEAVLGGVLPERLQQRGQAAAV